MASLGGRSIAAVADLRGDAHRSAQIRIPGAVQRRVGMGGRGEDPDGGLAGLLGKMPARDLLFS